MSHNDLMEQFLTIVSTGDTHQLQDFVNSNKAELQSLISQQHGAWSKSPTYQPAAEAWVHFTKGSGSAKDFSNLQRFLKSIPRGSQPKHEQDDRASWKAHDSKHSASSGSPRNSGAPSNTESSNQKNRKDKNHKNKKEAA